MYSQKPVLHICHPSEAPTGDWWFCFKAAPSGYHSAGSKKQSKKKFQLSLNSWRHWLSSRHSTGKQVFSPIPISTQAVLKAFLPLSSLSKFASCQLALSWDPLSIPVFFISLLVFWTALESVHWIVRDGFSRTWEKLRMHSYLYT